MKLFTPQSWPDYELMDTGGFQKLERFGNYILSRPEPKAIWDKNLSDGEWKRLAHATFRMKSSTEQSENEEKGEWFRRKEMPEQWIITFPCHDFQLKMRLGLTPFRHVGIFPEQAANWTYIYEQIKNMPVERPKFLNLFAYTGAASVIAKAAGAEVTHVEALKQLISWTRENMELSGLDNIRWMLEDAVKFVEREVRRGNTYHGIIMDPPAYGRGPKGEKWKLEDSINELLKNCRQLLAPENHFTIINLYAKGTSPLITENLFDTIYGEVSNKECGELYQADNAGRKLPYGSLLRFSE